MGDVLFYLLLFLFPFLCAFQRYAVAYGYEGKSKSTARDEAWRVWSILAIGCFALFLIHQL